MEIPKGITHIHKHCNIIMTWKQTLLEPVTDDENIEFPTSSMVIKREYSTEKEGWVCISGL